MRRPGDAPQRAEGLHQIGIFDADLAKSTVIGFVAWAVRPETEKPAERWDRVFASQL